MPLTMCLQGALRSLSWVSRTISLCFSTWAFPDWMVCRCFARSAAKNDIPVIILTARDALEDRLNGLDAGADDYLVKPFHMSELLARMRAVMRRRNGAAANVLSNGDLSLSEAAKTVERAGQTYTLTKREYALLSALLARPGAILSRRALEDRIYAVGEEPDSNAVEYLIHALRKKLGADAVKNVRGLGWMVAGRDTKPE